MRFACNTPLCDGCMLCERLFCAWRQSEDCETFPNGMLDLKCPCALPRLGSFSSEQSTGQHRHKNAHESNRRSREGERLVKSGQSKWWRNVRTGLCDVGLLREESHAKMES